MRTSSADCNPHRPPKKEKGQKTRQNAVPSSFYQKKMASFLGTGFPHAGPLSNLPQPLQAIHGKAQELELQLVPIRILAPANLLIDGHGPIDDAPKDVFCDMSRNALFFCHISDEMAFFHGEDLFHHQRQNGVILHEGMIFGNIDEAMTRRQPVILSLEHSKVILPDYIP